MNQTTLALVIAGLAALLGAIVLLNNYKSQTNKRYAAMSFFIALWVSVNALSLYFFDPELNNFLTRLITPSSLLALFAIASFVLVFPSRESKDTKLLERRLLILPLYISLFAFTDLNVQQYVSEDGWITYEFGALYYPYVFTMIMLTFFIFYKIYMKIKTASTKHKKKLIGVSIGISLTVLPSMTLGVILPLFDNYTYWNYSHYFVGFLPLAISYTIIKHQLFDIRLLTARLLAYGLSLGLLASLYGLIITFFTTNVFEAGSSLGQTLTLALIAAMLMLVFLPLKKWFDKVTIRMFFHNPYDSDVVLEKLSGQLVKSGTSQMVAANSSKVIKKYLRPNKISMYLVDGKQITGFNKNEHKLNSVVVSKLIRLGRTVSSRSILDEGDIKDLFIKFDLSAVSQLKSTDGEIIGVILLGPKSSGEIYRDQDMILLDIVGAAIGIAFSDVKRFDEINALNKSLKQKVDAATKELKAANRRLRQLDKAKDDFISATSHQLKPQIAAAGGFINIVKDEQDGQINSDQRVSLEGALQGVYRMEKIVDDILDKATQSNDTPRLNAAKVDLLRLITDEIEQVEHLAKEKGIRINYESETTRAVIRADETLLHEAFSNILTNAIQYSEGGGKVSVTIKGGNDKVTVAVVDFGIGVPRKDQKEIFKKFVRSQNAKGLRPVGTGIGLYITKQIIEAHGGEVIFKSVEEEGSTFGFTLPVS